MSITSIEDLSNEFFYEIFEYLHGCDIYQAFSDLNYRFQQLLNSSFLLYKIKIDYSAPNETLVNNYKQLILHNKSQILSIDLWESTKNNPITSSFTVDSSFYRLESIEINSIESDLLLALLPKLVHLPRLFSLKIGTWSIIKDLSTLYQSIFSLPRLKYITCSIPDSDSTNATISLPLATKEQISSIEYFTIDHFCPFDQLGHLLSYTPNLHRLKYLNITESSINIQSMKPVEFSNLRHLSINDYRMMFNEFEMFIKKFNSPLKVLSFTTIVDDLSYLDSNRWEQLILQNLIQLEEFHFTFQALLDDDYQTPMYDGAPNPFMSPFWIERQWMLNTAIEFENVIYSISPYKKRWYEQNVQQKKMNSFDEWSKSVRLDLSDAYTETTSKIVTLKDYIGHVFSVTEIYHLEIHLEICIAKLSEILHLLPKLDSLKIYRFSYSRSKDWSIEAISVHCCSLTQNRIRMLYLDNINLIEEIYFFMKIFQCVAYLHVNLIQPHDIRTFVPDILMHIMIEHKYPLRSLCFRLQMVDDKMIQELEQIIHSKNLLSHFMVKRVMNQVHLQCN